jgi:hypothetical protein
VLAREGDSGAAGGCELEQVVQLNSLDVRANLMEPIAGARENGEV